MTEQHSGLRFAHYLAHRLIHYTTDSVLVFTRGPTPPLFEVAVAEELPELGGTSTLC